MRLNGYPLEGVRILDMATVFAAPFAATLCADMGASVVKLELPAGGDTLRSLVPVHDGEPLFWKTANRGKQGISLDVRKAQGRDIFLQMLPQFDVLVENFRTGTMDKWGLDLATLHAHNPKLIVLRVTGFGQSGPYARRPGFARIFEAMSGFANLCGEPDRPPQHMNYPLGDAMAGLFGAFSIACALAERNAQPPAEQCGVEIDLSATEAMLRMLDPLPAELQFSGLARQRTGSRATYTAPSNVYQTGDGVWVTVVATGDTMFRRLCEAMAQPALATDTRFASNTSRIEHLELLDDIITAWCRTQSFETLAQTLSLHDLPFSKINDIADAMADPHLQARKAFCQIDDDTLGKINAISPVPRFSGRNAPSLRSGPNTGRDNASFYASLGLDSQALEQLRVERVI